MASSFNRLLQDYKHMLIGQLLTQNAFIVPPNQRPYSWTADDWEDLWQDLLDIIDKIEDEEADPFYGYHFFGPMFFLKEPSSDNLKILDGQQRIVTIEVLLAAIRDIMGYFQITGHMSPVGRDLPGKISIYSQSTGNASANRVTLGKENKAFFERILAPIPFESAESASLFAKNDSLREESKESSSSGLILKCYRYFILLIAKKLSAESGEDWPRGRPDYGRVTRILVDNSSDCEILLNMIFEAVTGRFYVLKAVVPDLEIMYRMFETLNQRGEKLVVADLFKNLLFERFERRIGEEEVEHLWAELESAVTDDFMADFLRHYWLSKYRFVRTNDLFRDIKQEIDRLQSNQAFRQFMRETAAEGGIYKSLRSPDDFRWLSGGVRQIVDEIKYLGFKQGYPLLLAAYVNCFDTNPAKFTELMTAYLNLVVRSYTILAENPNEFETKYSEWAISIRQGTRTIDQVVAEISEETPSDQELHDGLIEMNGVSPQVGHYILTKINDAQQDSLAAAWPNHPTVEHVIPQNPEEEWKEFLRTNGMKPKSFVDRLGNLTILSAEANSELGNLPYETKRARYLETRLPINTSTFEGSDFALFNAATIRKREEVMADLVAEYELWTESRRRTRPA